MRILLSTTSGAGHFRPLLPFAQALLRAGHELACAAPVEAADMVEREGLRHLPFGGVPDDDPDRGAVFARFATASAEEARQMVVSQVFGRINTTAALPGGQAAVASFAPDLVIHDAGECAVRLAAEAAGIPAAAVNPSLLNPLFFTLLASGVAELRTELGLEPDADGAQLLSAPMLSAFPASFDFPEAAAHNVHRFRDPRLEVTAAQVNELIYVTFGSEAHSFPFFAPVLRDAVAGALTGGLPVVVSSGVDLESSVLGGLDGDLTVERWVDQAEVIARARAVVCHGGSGSTMGALAAGVPLVVVPLFADQPDNAERVVATGCGIRVDPGPELGHRVGAAVQELVGERPSGSHRIAADIAALPTADEAVPWLESLTAG